MSFVEEKVQADFCTLRTSELKFVKRACDLCGSKEAEPVYSVSFLGLKFSFVRCPACSLVYQNPVLDKESLERIYETLEYWDHRHKVSAESTMLNYYSYLGEKEIRRSTAELRVKSMMGYLPEGSRVLDLGCSDGSFVRCLSGHGYRTSGIDISNAMISYGRKNYGVDIYRADFEEDWPFTEAFDAITCYATLSNIVNPSRVFANIRKHLRPGGYFFFNFGDCNRLVSRLLKSRLYLYRPTVCTIYSKKTISDYCNNQSLRILKIFNDVQVVPLLRLFGFLRIPLLMQTCELLRLEKSNLKMALLTGYTACAVRER
ncbi:MAG: class I SAM-dependent methyltransferase [Candidatus Omnitrophica bacterium]|nr:class I SAM-dependent methyltransferase [Candidatus Omnitrophota bacterium]MDD5237455.1 class I SAM-dependent methyltransferase [Candidatus Omnitrophota bacterium]